jgi:hypothetical protein
MSCQITDQNGIRTCTTQFEGAAHANECIARTQENLNDYEAHAGLMNGISTYASPRNSHFHTSPFKPNVSSLDDNNSQLLYIQNFEKFAANARLAVNVKKNIPDHQGGSSNGRFDSSSRADADLLEENNTQDRNAFSRDLSLQNDSCLHNARSIAWEPYQPDYKAKSMPQRGTFHSQGSMRQPVHSRQSLDSSQYLMKQAQHNGVHSPVSSPRKNVSMRQSLDSSQDLMKQAQHNGVHSPVCSPRTNVSRRQSLDCRNPCCQRCYKHGLSTSLLYCVGEK